MNIAIVKESLCIGGTERSAANISRALAEHHNVFTVLFNENDVQYPYGGKLIGLSAPPKKGFIGKVINSFIRSVRLKKIIRRYNIETAFVMTGISGYLMHEKLRECRKIISCRDFGALKTNIKYFAHALKRADAIVFNSEYQKDFYVQEYPDDSDKCFVSYNIIDTEFINSQSMETVEAEFTDFLSKHTVNIVSCGRFCREKGYEHLIKAFKTVKRCIPNAGLTLIGDGELRVKYETLIDEYGLNRDVYFTGFQPNPYKYMALCDIFVLSSVSEGFPNVIPEAMVCGLPVISTNCFTGPAEILSTNRDYEIAKTEYALCDYGILTPRFGICKASDRAAETELANAVSFLAFDERERSKLKLLSQKRAADFSKEAALNELERVIKFVGKAE